MTVTAKPIVLNDDGTKHVALSEGSYIDNASIDKESLVSKDTDNILKTGSDGQLLVAKSDLPSYSASDFVSADAGNQVVLGSDDKLYVANKPIQDLVSAADNVISVNPIDNKLQVDPEKIKKLANDEAKQVASDLVANAVVDAKADILAQVDTSVATAKTELNNNIDTAKAELNDSIDETKTKLSEDIADNTSAINELQNKVDSVVIVSADASNLLVRGSDNGAKVTASDLLSNGSAENLIKVNSVDQRFEVAKSDVQDVAKAVVADTSIVSNDAGNLLIKGSDKGAYLAASALPTQVSAGSGTSVDAGRVSVNVGKGLGINSANQLYVDTNDLSTISLETTEKILNLTTDNVLSATVSAQYNTATGYLTLYGKNSQVLSSVYIPGASSMLQSVEPVTNPTGQPAGKYFRYTFKTTEGSSVIYVPIPAATTVAAGNGIEVSTAGEITTVAVKTKAGSGITVSDDGLKADTSVLATKDEITTLQTKVEAIDVESMSFVVSSATVDPATLDKGEAAIYPSEDLLG